MKKQLLNTYLGTIIVPFLRELREQTQEMKKTRKEVEEKYPQLFKREEKMETTDKEYKEQIIEIIKYIAANKLYSQEENLWGEVFGYRIDHISIHREVDMREYKIEIDAITYSTEVAPLRSHKLIVNDIHTKVKRVSTY